MLPQAELRQQLRCVRLCLLLIRQEVQVRPVLEHPGPPILPAGVDHSIPGVHKLDLEGQLH